MIDMRSILLLPEVSNFCGTCFSASNCVRGTLWAFFLFSLQVKLYLQKLSYMHSEWLEGIYWHLD